MSRARDVASLLNTVATDDELNSASASLTTSINSVPTGRKNLLYNGAMQVHQRGTSTASITTAGYYTADRFRTAVNSLGTWTQTIENDAPSGSGLRKSLKVLCTTADAAPGGSDNLQVQQRLEGQDLQRIAKGTSNAQQLILSFWVKSNVTGTYIISLLDNNNSRHVSASYSISASATWEKKTITFPADTTGAFNNNNSYSLNVIWWLGSGSTFTSGTLATAWASVNNSNYAVGQTNLAAATNNYWQITGVQLEVGDTATDFEHKSFGVELAECQRYYQDYKDRIYFRHYVSNVIRFSMNVPLMRAAPTITRAWLASTGLGNDGIFCFQTPTATIVKFDMQYTGGGNGVIDLNNSTVFTLNAEL